MVEHWLFEQATFPVQSVFVQQLPATQISPHSTVPVLHTQVPDAQCFPVGHVFPQVPQLLLFVFRLVSHPVLEVDSSQFAYPVGQLVHVPDEQDWRWLVVQLDVVPVVQPHVPLVQVRVLPVVILSPTQMSGQLGHAMLQSPQLSTVRMFVSQLLPEFPSQFLDPAVHGWHIPVAVAQYWLVVQGVPGVAWQVQSQGGLPEHVFWQVDGYV